MDGYADEVVNRLCIISGRKRKDVSFNTCLKFKYSLDNFIEENLSKIKVRPVSIIFQNPKTPYNRNFKRKGVTYIEKSLDSIVKDLPKLEKGEYYDFPSIEFVLERDGTGVVYLRYA